MPLLLDIVTDLVNDIKESKDVSARLFSLEQIKEIVFHRDKTLLPAVVNTLSEFIVDKSASIRKFLLKFGGEALRYDINVFPIFLNMVGYILHDPNDGVLTLGIKEFQAFYGKIAVLIAEMPSGGGKNQSNNDPKLLWALFCKISLKFNEVISSTRTDALKACCLLLYETEILFGLPTSTSTADPRTQRSDPRLARVDPRLAKVQETKESIASSDNIPLHHAFINRNTLVTEAEDLYAKMLVWASTGGPHGFPFSSSLMAVLGRIIADISSTKPSNGINAAKALYLLIQGKGNMMSNMSGENRESIARAAHRMLRSVVIFNAPDPDGALQKLRVALDTLETLGFADSNTAPGQKRDRKSFEDAGQSSESNEDTEETLQLQEAAKRAVDLATLTGGGDLSKDALSSMLSGGVSGVGMNEVESTKLCEDFDKLRDQNSSLSSIRSNALTSTSYVELSFHVLRNLFLNFESMKQDIKSLNAYYALCVRTVLSLFRTELLQPSSFVNVRIVSAVSSSPSAALYFPSLVPELVELPKSFWIVICFVLENSTLSTLASSDRSKEVTEKLTFLTKFTNSLYGQFLNDFSSDVDDLSQNSAMQCYDAFCLSLLSRLLQTVSLRPLAKPFLLDLPYIPPSCLNVLFLLLETGSKPDIPIGKTSVATASKYRGTRQEALLLLASLVFSGDSGVTALNHLLWNCVAEDFEVRAKTVNILISDVLFAEEWCDERILQFALHSVISTFEGTLTQWYGNRLTNKVIKSEYSSYTLQFAFESFDRGQIFGGNFYSEGGECINKDFKKSFHLLLQLCAHNKLAIGSLVDIFCICSTIDSNVASEVSSYVLLELTNLLPALVHRESVDVVVEILVEFAQQHVEEVARSFMLNALNILFQDWILVPSKSVLDKIQSFLTSFQLLPVAEDAPSLPFNDLPIEDFKLMIPLISGFPAKEVAASLYSVLKLFGDDSDALQLIFNRVTKSRPPVLSKAQLLVDLHRLNTDGDLKPKSILDAIAVCLNNKTDYTSDVIKEALKQLLTDDVPAFPLMRTAILSSQAFSEVRRYVISEVIPSLIKKKIWISAPKVWEGVIYVIKHSTASSLKNDYVLKAILSVSGIQLKSIIKSAPNVVEHLVTLLASLSPVDKNELLAGRWIDPTLSKDIEVESDKLKTVQDLLTSRS